MRTSKQMDKTRIERGGSYGTRRNNRIKKNTGGQADKGLQNNPHLLDRIMETSPACITVVDAEGKIIFANAEAEKILNLSKDKLKQRSYNAPEWRITAINGGPFPDRQLPFRRVMSTGQPVFGIKHAIEWPDGNRRLLSINASPFKNKEGRLDGMVAVIEDITERSQTELKLQESEKRYRNIFERMLEGFALHEIICDEFGNPVDYRFLEINPAFEKLTGLRAADLIGRTCLTVLPGTEPIWISRYGKVALTGRHAHFESYSGELGKYYKVTAFSPQKYQFVTIFEDITERQQLEATLTQSEEKFSRFFHSNPSLSTITDLHSGETINVNQAFVDSMGYTMKEVVGRTTRDLNIWADPKARANMLATVMAGKKVRNVRMLIRTKSGKIRTMNFSAERFTIGNRDLLFTQAIDITAQLEAEKDLMESRDKLRNFGTRLQLAREEERKLIAREIHDDLGQSLTALQIDLAWLAKKIAPDAQQLVEKIKSMSKLMKEMDNKVKEISHSLRPQLLDDLGLGVAAQEYIKEFEDRTGIRCLLSVEPPELDPGPDNAITVFRILQEALTNIIRHAAARKVLISLRLETGNLLMKISDDGRGIKEKEITGTRSLGIIGMKERAMSLGGQLEIKGLKGKGTRISLLLPLNGGKLR